tara:strand:- start:4010 stop:5398 length:1389 start_codon:yes stop_codon:yes gene_type:complete
MNSSLNKRYKNQDKSINGWGKSKKVKAELINPKTVQEIKEFIIHSQPKSIIARGLGRSYGDAAQVNEGKVLSLKNFKEISPNYNNFEVTAQAGATFEEILKIIIPKGFFLPVTPGTKKITVGGAIAADVHGKNHHHDGSFGKYVKRLELINGLGENIILKPFQKNSSKANEKFWATIGGMGLTGIVIEATFTIIAIETSYIKQEITRHQKIEDLMKMMRKVDNKYKYSVAWIDSMHNDFRGVLTCGNHVRSKEINYLKEENLLSFNPKKIISIPDIMPNNLMNKLFIKSFNELWFRKAIANSYESLVTFEKFFYPLDAINNWNNIYGREGFIQYQFVIPEENESMIKNILKRLKDIKALTFLPVLKRLGKGNLGYLSFPMDGWTLSIDLRRNNKKIDNLLAEFDMEIASIGGRIYLAKDSRQSAIIFHKTYKLIDIWQKQKNILDPKTKFSSDIAKRLKIFN